MCACVSLWLVFAGLARLSLLSRSPVGERERGGFGGGATLAGAGLGVEGGRGVSHLTWRFLEYLAGIFWLFGLSSNLRAPSQSPGSTPSVFPFSVGR